MQKFSRNLLLCQNDYDYDIMILYCQKVDTLPCTLELELIQTQMAQKPMLRAEVGMRVRCANKASAG